jgi:PPP family 3-phenylpropionic acid transporter
MLFCSCYGYITYYLLSKGFSTSSVGIVTAVFGLMGAFLQPVIGRIIDNKVVIWKRIGILLALLMLICSIVLLCFENKIIQGLFFGITITSLNICLPLVNRVGFLCQTETQKINFGVARGFGSLSYACLSLLLGKLSVCLGSGIIPLSTSIISACMIILLFLMPKGNLSLVSEQKEASSNSLSVLVKYPAFTLMWISCVFQMIFHNLTNTYLINICERAGGSSETLGVALAIAAVVELPVLFLFAKINKHITVKNLLKISAIVFLIKAIGYFISFRIPLLYITQFLQFASFAIYASASVYYAENAVDENDKTTAQSFMSGSQTIGTVIGGLIGGFVISTYSLNAMLVLGIIIALFGACFSFVKSKSN